MSRHFGCLHAIRKACRTATRDAPHLARVFGQPRPQVEPRHLLLPEHPRLPRPRGRLARHCAVAYRDSALPPQDTAQLSAHFVKIIVFPTPPLMLPWHTGVARKGKHLDQNLIIYGSIRPPAARPPCMPQTSRRRRPVPAWASRRTSDYPARPGMSNYIVISTAYGRFSMAKGSRNAPDTACAVAAATQLHTRCGMCNMMQRCQMHDQVTTFS